MWAATPPGSSRGPSRGPGGTQSPGFAVCAAAEGRPEPGFQGRTRVPPPPPVLPPRAVCGQGRCPRSPPFLAPRTPAAVHGAGPTRPGPRLCGCWRSKRPFPSPSPGQKGLPLGRRPHTAGRGTSLAWQEEPRSRSSLHGRVKSPLPLTRRRVTLRTGRRPPALGVHKRPLAECGGAGGRGATHARSVAGGGRVGAGRPLQRVLCAGAGAGGARGAR